MIPEIRKILYATDLSPNAAYAFRYAISSAKKHDAKIVILQIVVLLPTGLGSGFASALMDVGGCSIMVPVQSSAA